MRASTLINVINIIIVSVLSSCSITGKLHSPNYHLALVKANIITIPVSKEINTNKPLAIAASRYCTEDDKLVNSPPKNLPIVKNEVQSTVSKIKFYKFKDKKLRRTSLNSIINRANNFTFYKFPVTKRSDLLDRPIFLFLICIMCIAVAVVCFVLSHQYPILIFIEYLSGVAAILFFGIWLIALADNYYG